MNTETISVLDTPLPDRYDAGASHAVESAAEVLAQLLDVEPQRDVIATDSGLGNITFHTVDLPSQVVRFHVTRGVSVPSWWQGTVECKKQGKYYPVDIEADLQFAIPDDRGGLVVQYAVTEG